MVYFLAALISTQYYKKVAVSCFCLPVMYLYVETLPDKQEPI